MDFTPDVMMPEQYEKKQKRFRKTLEKGRRNKNESVCMQRKAVGFPVVQLL